jgi:hypothetical protein
MSDVLFLMVVVCVLRLLCVVWYTVMWLGACMVVDCGSARDVYLGCRIVGRSVLMGRVWPVLGPHPEP